jgi:3-hydroxyisobutyrate dehydrogenase-like beta-hydroxyacid dehydrogenase
MEILAFAVKLGLPLENTRDLLLSGPAWSWMLGHRGRNMIDGLIQPPTSTVNIFVKDMSIVCGQAAVEGLGVPMAACVEQIFRMAQANGWGADDDSR